MTPTSAAAWPEPGPLLRVRGVERRFDTATGSTLALQSTDLDVAENDFVTILGPSGCGKSTLLRIVAGLDHPTAGEVLLGGQAIGGLANDVGVHEASPGRQRVEEEDARDR